MWSAPYDLSIDAARADALFASALQIPTIRAPCR